MEEVNGSSDVVLVVLKRLLSTLPDGFVSGDMDDTVDSPFRRVRLEDLLDISLERDVSLEQVDFAVFLVGFRGRRGESVDSDLGEAGESGRERVGEAGVRGR